MHSYFFGVAVVAGLAVAVGDAFGLAAGVMLGAAAGLETSGGSWGSTTIRHD